MAKLWMLVMAALMASVSGQSTSNICSKHLLDVRAGEAEYNPQFCTARYGNFHKQVYNVHGLITEHIRQSFLYSLVGSYFETDSQNRFGFGKYMHDFGEEMWDDAVELIQYVGKRGSSMAPNDSPKGGLKIEELHSNLGHWSEIEALGLALDGMHNITSTVHGLHLVMKDPSFEGFIEQRFTAKHSDKVRQLAGYLTNLAPMLEEEAGKDLALYLFDQSFA